MKKIHLLLIYLILPIMVFAATSSLIKPTKGTIIDIGTKQPITKVDTVIQKDWIDISAAVREIDLLIYPKQREEERYDCLTDEYNIQNCPVGLTTCQVHDEYSAGEAESHSVHLEEPAISHGVPISTEVKICNDHYLSAYLIYVPSQKQIQVLYINGSPGLLTGKNCSYSFKTTNITNIDIDPDYEFQMNIHSWGGGCSERNYDVTIRNLPTAAKLKTEAELIQMAVDDGVLTVHEVNNGDKYYKMTNSNKDGYYFFNIAYCSDSGAQNPSVKFEAEDLLECDKDYYKLDEANSKCILDYKYYDYICSEPTEEDLEDDNITGDSLNQNAIWIGPLVSTGGDCGGVGLNANEECQSSNPPAHNCLRKSYTCPVNPTQKCTKIPEESDSGVGNYGEGFIYSKGYSVEYKKTLIKNKKCRKNSYYNEETDSCLSTNSYACLEEGFVFEPLIGECMKFPVCEGMLDPATGACLTSPEINCTSGYEYNQFSSKCERVPFCDKGTYNSYSHICQEEGKDNYCPQKYKYNTITSRCEKDLTTQVRDNCEKEFEYDKELGKCILDTADFTDWTIFGLDSNWEINKTTVTQTINGDNTYLISPYTLGTSIVLEGKFRVDNDGDNDWAGIVFGWQGTNDLYLFDWKKDNQNASSRGLRLMHITDSTTNLWSSKSTDNMTLLASDYNYNGWSYGTTYTLRVQYTFHQIIAYINEKEVLRYENPYLEIPGGKVGFFNLSQSKVTYSDYYIESDPTCDEGYTYNIPYDTCYIEEPEGEEDFELGIAWVYPSCPNGSFNKSTLKCEYTPTCSDFGDFIPEQNICQLSADINCSKGTKITTQYEGYEIACSSTEQCPGTQSYQEHFNDIGDICISGKIPSCEAGESLNETLNACESMPFCEKGYKINEEGKCFKEYTWYNYFCENGWEGPAKPGKDCLGNCGDFGCSCNPETPLPNNCRKSVSQVYSEQISSTRQMILHPVSGELTPEEFGSVKTYQCGDNCLYIVDSINAEGNKLCFHKKNGEENCFTIENCNFYGEIINSKGIKELQVGVETNTTGNKGLYQYTLAEGSEFKTPEIANPDTISCYDDSTKYNKEYRECRMNEILDLRKWDIYGADAKWEFEDNGTLGVQKYNTSEPTLLLHPSDFGDAVQLSGKIKTTDNDDDWIGLTFGATGENADSYYRFTWHTAGGGNKDSGFDFTKVVNGVKTTLVSDIVSGSSKGYKRKVWYTFGLTYSPGVIIGYVNGTEVLRYEDPALKISGKVGFYGYSQANVYYKDFALSTSPKCPDGYFYQSLDKQCLKLVETGSTENVIHSTCKMNGHVGYFDNENGIVSAVVGSSITKKLSDSIADSNSNIFVIDDNKTKDPSHRIEFWDSYSIPHYIGFIEFVKDVKDEDRVDGFAPIYKLPYSLGQKGFTAINTLDGYTYFVSVDGIGYGMTNSECNEIANEFGLERRTSFNNKEDLFLKILAGNRHKDSLNNPVCSDGNYNPVTNTCDHAIDPAPFRFCLFGELTTDSNCTINKRCVLRTANLDTKTFNTSDQALKTTYVNGDSTYKCSQYLCKEGQCNLRICPEGFKGDLLLAETEVSKGTCIDNTCDGNKDYIPYCGKENGCPKGSSYVYTESSTGPCYEYYCKDGGTFDEKTKKCKALKCPANTHEIEDGTCRRN